MYVRLGFAVAIHTDPDLLLVDEVLAVGDQSFQHKCMGAIQEFRDRGGTLLLVSHDLNAIQNICHRAIWLEQGLVQSAGQPTDVVMDYLRDQARREEQAQWERHAEIRAQELAAGGAVDERTVINEPGRWGSGRVRITAVELCDGSGRKSFAFGSGESFTVRIHYAAPQRVERPVFGVGVYHETGAHVSGPNTQFGGLTIPAIEGEGVVSYKIPSLPLLAGRYRLAVAALDEGDGEMFDYHDRLYDFQVYPNSSERYGLVTLGGFWAVEQAGAPVENGRVDNDRADNDRAGMSVSQPI
jgi:lipopolysaccharide transport system ATP-binding protein